MIFTLFLGLLLLYANSANAQNNITILDIIDSLGLLDILTNLDNPQSILDEINLEKACNSIRNKNSTTLCAKQLEIICNDPENLIRMLDASSKFPYSGMLVKTKVDFGSFDECVKLDVTQNKTNILGKYCLAGVIIPTTPLNDSDVIQNAYKLATCIPDKCSAMELLEFLNLTDIYPLFNDFNCQTKNSYKQLGWDDYAVISLFAALLLALVLATLLEVFYYYTRNEYKNLFIEAFSVLHNGKKIFRTSKGSSDQIGVLHGIRVIAMFFIVIGHAYITMEIVPGFNIEFIENFKKSWKSIYITRSYLDVDSFFFLSGLLFAYQYLKLKPANLLNHIQRIPMLIFHRYLRITPVAASAYLIVTTFYVHLGDGPLAQEIGSAPREACIKHWWSYFFYLQNYSNYDDLCIVTTWYLSADFQLFLISPLVLIPVAIYIKSRFKLVMWHLALLNLLVTILPVAFKFWFEDFDNPYETHARLSSYFTGVMLGVYMRETSYHKIRLSKRINLIIWIIVLIIMILTQFAYDYFLLLVNYENDKMYQTYFIFVRTFWCLGLGWIVYACHNGYGGFINRILTTPYFQVLSKLTFCMYVLHVLVLGYPNMVMRAPMVLSALNAIIAGVFSYVVTIPLSLIWTLMFESPLITLEKRIFKG